MRGGGSAGSHITFLKEMFITVEFELETNQKEVTGWFENSLWCQASYSFLLFLSGIFSSLTSCQSVYTLELNFHLRFLFQETLTHFFTQ